MFVGFIQEKETLARLRAVISYQSSVVSLWRKLTAFSLFIQQFQKPKKFENSGLTAEKAQSVDAPVINEFPLCLECEFVEFQDDTYGIGVIGKVICITADSSVMVNGKPDMSLVNAIAFDPYTHGYYRVSERVGEAFHDGLALKK